MIFKVMMEVTPEQLIQLGSVFMEGKAIEIEEVPAITPAPKAEPIMTDAEAVEAENKKAETKPEITKGKLRAISVKITKAGKSDELKEVFKKYGAAKLSELKEEDYAAVYADLEEING